MKVTTTCPDDHTIPLLRVEAVSKMLQGHQAVSAIRFVQHQGENLAILGQTGSGKSTLLQLIAGLIQADSGKLYYGADPIIGPQDQLFPGRKEIGYLSQHFELRNNYAVHEILEMANQFDQQSANQLYRLCRIDQLLLRRTNQLSGGERQRIALARLLSTGPSLLLLDEPFTNLDRSHRQQMKQVLRDLAAQRNISFLLVSHDEADVLPWADRILVLEAGRLIQEGSPEHLYTQPVSEYVAALTGEYNRIEYRLSPQLRQLSSASAEQETAMVRPEYIQLAARPGEGLAGRLLRQEYAGAGYWLEVQVDAQVLRLRTKTPVPAGIVQVWIEFLPGAFWHWQL